MQGERKLYMPTVEIKPVQFVVFEPHVLDREKIINAVKAEILSVMKAKEISIATFNSSTHFPIGERLLYVPEIENTRKFLKVQMDNEWYREKPDLKIDKDIGAIDILILDRKVYIKIMVHRFYRKTSVAMLKAIALKLSTYNTAYYCFHQRAPSSENAFSEVVNRSNDMEYFAEYKNTRLITARSKNTKQQDNVFDWVKDVYEIDIEAIVESFDRGVEISRAPYDIKEYRERLKQYHISTGDIEEIPLDEDGTETVKSETTREKQILEALIRETEKIAITPINFETVYFKFQGA